jgi:antitoxin ParD1/3/4
MDMLQIDLPEPMKRFAEDRAAESGYGSVGEYVRGLIRSDLERRGQERIDALLLEGLDSGPPILVTPEYWEEKKRKLIERHGPASPPR